MKINNRNKPVLIIGGSGMLGQALKKTASDVGLHALTMARTDADFLIDIANTELLKNFDFSLFGAVINTAAVTSIDQCEKNPEEARRVNTAPLGLLAEKADQAGFYLIQISTDHYFSGDGSKRHDESAQVKLVNEYAKSKFEGEKLALSSEHTLVVRTNIAGWRGWAGRPTFIEGILNKFEKNESITAFTDYFTSSIEVGQISELLFKLIERPKIERPTGILNLASSQVASKKEFIEAFALGGGLNLNLVSSGSVKSLQVPRAESAGLNVGLAEKFFDFDFPDLDKVVEALWNTRRRTKNAV